PLFGPRMRRAGRLRSFLTGIHYRRACGDVVGEIIKRSSSAGHSSGSRTLSAGTIRLEYISRRAAPLPVPRSPQLKARAAPADLRRSGHGRATLERLPRSLQPDRAQIRKRGYARMFEEEAKQVSLRGVPGVRERR